MEHTNTPGIINLNKIATLGLGGVLALATVFSVGLRSPVSAEACIQNAPEVTITSLANQTGDAGSTLNYTVNVKNVDSVDCAQSSVSVQNNASGTPSGWTVASGTATDLLPGQSQDFSVLVTSSASSLNGDYNLPFWAVKVYSQSTPEEPFATITDFNLGYTVVNGSTADTEAPVVTVASPANGTQVLKGSTTHIVASATDNVAVTQINFYVNGELLCSGTSANCAWQVPDKKGKRTYNLEVRAYDAAGNVSSAYSTVTAL